MTSRQKQLKQNKKHNYRIYECNKEDAISGYQEHYIVTDYNGYLIKEFAFYWQVEKFIKAYTTYDNFLDDTEKMEDFKNMTEQEFLKFYNYIDKNEYDWTKRLYYQY